jgi:hypothetical protein
LLPDAPKLPPLSARHVFEKTAQFKIVLQTVVELASSPSEWILVVIVQAR